MLQTITNLYPYPSQRTRGVFNLQLFRELGNLTEVRNTVLVANTNPLKAPEIRTWTAPPDVPAATYVPYQHIPVLGRNLAWRFIAHALRSQTTDRRPQTADGKRPSLPTVHSPRSTADMPTSDLGHPPSALRPPSSILSSWLYPDGTAAAMAYRRSGTPVWTMVLGTDRFHLQNPRRRKTIMAADRHTAGYICVSQNIADDLAAAGLPQEKLHVIRNGVDTTRFHPIPREQAVEKLPPFTSPTTAEPTADCRLQTTDHRPQTADCRPLVVFIGNLVPIKAPDLAIRAFAEFASQDSTSNCQLVMIGDGPLRSSLEDSATKLDIANRVHFLGRRPHDEIPLWLNAADCLLLSSHSEGMPNAVTEALACGCPVTATDVGACAEMLQDQPCCRIVPTDAPHAMANALSAVITEARQAQERPTFTRTWADMARDIVELMA